LSRIRRIIVILVCLGTGLSCSYGSNHQRTNSEFINSLLEESNRRTILQQEIDSLLKQISLDNAYLNSPRGRAAFERAAQLNKGISSDIYSFASAPVYGNDNAILFLKHLVNCLIDSSNYAFRLEQEQIFNPQCRREEKLWQDTVNSMSSDPQQANDDMVDHLILAIRQRGIALYPALDYNLEYIFLRGIKSFFLKWRSETEDVSKIRNLNKVKPYEILNAFLITVQNTTLTLPLSNGRGILVETKSQVEDLINTTNYDYAGRDQDIYRLIETLSDINKLLVNSQP
jgi:hypothetical protein